MSDSESKEMKDLFGEEDSESDSKENVNTKKKKKDQIVDDSGLFDSDDDSEEEEKEELLNSKKKTIKKRNIKVDDSESNSDSENMIKAKKLKLDEDKKKQLFSRKKNPTRDDNQEENDVQEEEDAATKRKRILEKKLLEKQSEEISSSMHSEKKKKNSVARNSGDEYESEEEIAVSKEDTDFIDDDDDLADVLKEYDDDTQNFDDSRPLHNANSSDEDEESKENIFDATLASLRTGRRRGAKLSATTEEQVELTREILSLIEEAWEKDQKEINEGRPGIHKVVLLPRLLNYLSKVLLQTMLLDYDFLGIIKRWIQPNEKGELPNLSIRTQLLKAIDKLPIEKDHLKPSGFGKVIMSLWKHPKEVKENKDLCQKMIERWSRTVFEKTTDYKKLSDMGEEELRQYRPYRPPSRNLVNSITTQGSDRVRIPQPMVFDFVRRPQSKALDDRQTSKPSAESAKGKLMKRMQNIARPTRKNVRAINMSVEGRGMS